jgi:hypothetical protein
MDGSLSMAELPTPTYLDVTISSGLGLLVEGTHLRGGKYGARWLYTWAGRLQVCGVLLETC